MEEREILYLDSSNVPIELLPSCFCFDLICIFIGINLHP